MNHPGSVETPIGVVDLDRARANAEKVAAYVADHGLRWRPHIKTHKSRRIASIQLEAGATGLTVATLREAEVMSSLTDDILLAYPQIGEARLKRLLALPERVDLKVALDSSEALLPMARAFHQAGRSIGVLVEEDVGMGRVGLSGAAQVGELAEMVAGTPGADFRGVMFYPGHIRMDEKEQDEHLKRVSTRVGETLTLLEERSLRPEIVSGGSTPTLWKSHLIEGLTEIRSGSCIYYDREGLEIGVASLDDLAYTVLATVVSTAVPGRAVVDAGSKALAKESRGGGGFGIVLDRPDVVVVSVSEEHGVLDIEHGSWQPEIGERVRIVPNHVCVSVNLQDHLLGCAGKEWSTVELEGRGRGAWKP